jgi:hypothetical protein
MKAQLKTRSQSIYLAIPKQGMAPMLFMEWISLKRFVDKSPVAIHTILDRKDQDLDRPYFTIELSCTAKSYQECVMYINDNL